ncbi:microtubule associated protein 1B [Phyllostomus discolor]|uniref:Microtubule associated protein 1B n=1 Tax=Phyllostomus discolor TaxID=89673 RepID=A0A834BCX9_9CHIR|nr:microtubule associated protein 1B [Phyllostomus discolor]
MATVVVEAAEPELSGSIANPAASTSPSLSHRFLDSKFYLLVVVGEIVTEEHLRRAIGNIELGIRSWDTNLIEFFKRVRSSYYVVSGNDPAAEEPSRAVLDALLEGKAQWGSNMQVTLIPTHDSEVMREWYQETHEKQQDLNIMVLASSSTVVMQDESFPACKIEL